MVFAAYLLEIGKYNFRVVLGWGICTLFLTPTVGFLYELRAPSGAFAPFPKQNDKFLTNAWGEGGWGRLELTEP